MNIYVEHTLNPVDRGKLLQRSSTAMTDISDGVGSLCRDIQKRGDAAVREYTKRFDGFELDEFLIPESEFIEAEKTISVEFAEALRIAAHNIKSFHAMQMRSPIEIETMSGVVCRREIRPIERVGLYVPAGSAPLPSTVLMLGIPALLAGCSQIIVCSPPKQNGSVDSYVLAAARAIGLGRVYKIGGAQAIAALAYGTESVPKVDKIFGPGNKYVAAAKQYVSTDPHGSTIDMLAGPSEVLIIADGEANPEIIALDLISQAEHDPDARAVLVTTDAGIAQAVAKILPSIILQFPRKAIIEQSLKQSFAFVADSQESAIRFSNDYAPEHLVINTKDAHNISASIINAGSVFLGGFSPVTAGDYASGTNHTLPTNGTARWSSGLSLESFQKTITFQTVTSDGLQNLEPTLTTLSHAEGLQAHAKAVTKRLQH